VHPPTSLLLLHLPFLGAPIFPFLVGYWSAPFLLIFLKHKIKNKNKILFACWTLYGTSHTHTTKTTTTTT